MGPSLEKAFDCHPPPPTGRALGVCTGPNFKKRKKEKPDRKDFFLSNNDCEENEFHSLIPILRLSDLRLPNRGGRWT